MKQQFPGLSIGDCAKKLGEMWSKLSQSDKQPYEEKAQKLREKYDRVRVQTGLNQTRHSTVQPLSKPQGLEGSLQGFKPVLMDLNRF